MTWLMAWAILLPLAGASLTFLAGRRSALLIGVAVSAGTLVIAGVLAWRVLDNGPERVAVGGWDPPLGIALYVDGLSALMLLMTAAVMTMLGIYATGYFSEREARRSGGWSDQAGFLPLWLFVLAALNALFLSVDIFNLYVALELLTMAGIALVILAGGRTAVMAGMRYLLAAFLGSLLYLLGVVILYAGYDTLDLHLLGARAEAETFTMAALAFITIGLMIKTALFPFHAWLPQAHASAPAPVSAMLSGLVVKASFYLVLRIWIDAFEGVMGTPAAQAVGLLGAAGIVWGSLQALREQTIKLVVAHSTVAQVGYLFLMLPLIVAPEGAGEAAWRFGAWSGGVYHMLSHAFAKAALFLCAGTVLYAFGNDSLQSMRGLARRLPVTTFAFGIGGIALIGLPPSGSFIAKWMLLTASIGSAQWWWAFAIALGTLLSGGYVFRIMRRAFESVGEEGDVQRRTPRTMEVTSLLLALVALSLGLRATEPMALLEVGSPIPPVVIGED